jgi:hypothetical protein
MAASRPPSTPCRSRLRLRALRAPTPRRASKTTPRTTAPSGRRGGVWSATLGATASVEARCACPQSFSHALGRLRSRMHADVRTHASMDSVCVCGGRQVDAVLDLKKVVLGEKGEDEMVLKFWAPKRRPKETVRLRGHTGCTSPERIYTASPAHASLVHSRRLAGFHCCARVAYRPTGVCFRTRAARDEPLLHWL